MVDETSPKARQNFATTQSSRFLSEAEATARELLGRTMNTARAAGGAAGAAQGSADDAQADATQALADAAAAQSTANTAVTNAATAQTTANGKVALPTGVTSATDADITFTATVSNTIFLHTAVLTVNRTVTLDPATNKWQARFVRTGVDIFFLDIGGLKSLPSGTWCDVYYNGAAWVLTAFGTL